MFVFTLCEKTIVAEREYCVGVGEEIEEFSKVGLRSKWCVDILKVGGRQKMHKTEREGRQQDGEEEKEKTERGEAERTERRNRDEEDCCCCVHDALQHTAKLKTVSPDNHIRTPLYLHCLPAELVGVGAVSRLVCYFSLDDTDVPIAHRQVPFAKEHWDET